jgi:hypothetical protein
MLERKHFIGSGERAGLRASVVFAVAALLALVGCTGPGAGVGSPRETPTVTAAQAIALHSDSIMAIPGVVGLYEGRTDKGETVIRVMLAQRTRETVRKLPRKLEGYRVEVEESGPITPMAK